MWNDKSTDWSDSVKVINKPKKEILRFLKHNLSECFIGYIKEKEEVFYFSAFLPPKYHLLFKFVVNENSTRVFLKSDYWRIFSFMDNFIK